MTGIKQTFATPLTSNSPTPLEPLGSIRREGKKTYKYVQFDNGTGNVAAVAGNVCYYTIAGHAANQVCSDLSDCVVAAGVFQAALTDQYYGWIQIRGPATLTTALTAGADGNALTMTGATDGTLDVSAAVTDHICAVAIDASEKLVNLLCPF